MVPEQTPREVARSYVLGTDEDELIRLGLQHRVWRAAAYAIWERARFGPGQTLLDIGAGPGYTTRDLAELVGPDGTVKAVEISTRFAEYLRRQAIPNVVVIQGDAQELVLEDESLDGAYARWLFTFVPSPERVVAHVTRALRSGAVFAIQDYVSYGAARLGPPSEALKRVFDVIIASWKQHGGDADVGCRLPTIIEQAGLIIRDLRPHARIARPGTALWEWPTTFFHNFVPKLVEDRFLSQDEARIFFDEWARASTNPAAFLLTPIVLDLIAEKPNTPRR
jgi:ubiquinone/menaquinone biosynthesis C-methylase UbiE